MKQTASYSFYSKDLNRCKYDIFVAKAIAIRDFKNKLSLEIASDLNKYLDYSKFDLVARFGKIKDNPFTDSKIIRGNELQKAVADVFDTYENKLEAVIRKLQFKIQKELRTTYYKRKTNNKKGSFIKGDLKEYKVILKSTKLSKVMTYLGRYGSLETLDYIKSLDKPNELHQDVLFYSEKYGFDRLLKLAESKRSFVIQKYNKPIEFKKLSYRSAIQAKDHQLLQNNNGFTNGYIVIPSINGSGSRKIIVPTNFSTKHHGHLNQYKSDEYLVCVEKNRIRIITTKSVDVNYSKDKYNFIGIDTNLKHNLFSCSNGKEIDVDRKIFNDYVRFLKKIDSHSKNLSNGEEKQKSLWQTRMSSMLKEKSSNLVKLAKAEDYNHLIMEDLGVFGKGFAKDENLEGFKYSRLVKLLHLSDLNNVVKSIAQKNNVQLTLIPSHYTSQLCSKCGCISRENRKTQENFVCVECNETSNADLNSSINIHLIGRNEVQKMRYGQKVSGSLLVKDKSSKWYIPKKLNKFQIRKHLEDIVVSSSFQKSREKLIDFH